MNKFSFYDLDYIIDLNERRLEQYTTAYQKNLDKFTNLLIVYSAIGVFLVPVIQTLFLSGVRHWLHYASFFFFLPLFIYSVTYTIRLLIPIEVAYLIEPKIYYEKLRLQYEQDGKNEELTNRYLKASYINELEKAVAANNYVFKRKGLFYYRAFSTSLMAVIPYLLCLAFHFLLKKTTFKRLN
jgi:hypothetical protein